MTAPKSADDLATRRESFLLAYVAEAHRSARDALARLFGTEFVKESSDRQVVPSVYFTASASTTR